MPITKCTHSRVVGLRLEGSSSLVIVVVIVVVILMPVSGPGSVSLPAARWHHARHANVH